MAAAIPDVNAIRTRALQNFEEQFKGKASVCVCAPGRVNLIGEHTDYNEGFVLPMALPMVTIIAGRPNQTTRCKIISSSESLASTSTAEFDLNNIEPGDPNWANYVKGSVANFHETVKTGFDCVILSTVPMGAGLSSSAALEVATYTFLEVLTGRKAAKLEEKALACQRAEHDFAGVPCGIMDQFISVMGQDGHALLLDCRDLTTKQITLANFADYSFLVINSNAPHKLSSSAYRERKECCEESARMLGKKSLREANLSDLQILKEKGASEEVIKRARHVITEIQRTMEASRALEAADFAKFGKLMNESHDSLRDDYEVSSQELDQLVNAAREVKGVLGSRLTGAGFGGCTVTLLHRNSVDPAIEHIRSRYSGSATFYIAKPATGARELETGC